MTGLTSSQLDDFLNFIDFFLIQISAQGNLLSIRPAHKTFLQWRKENWKQFNFRDHFLTPNDLTMELFLSFFEIKDYNSNHFLWKGQDGKVSPPLPTFMRLARNREGQRFFLMFVKDPEEAVRVSIPATDKKFLFQARGFPGLIHNINGPLGTITGRIELMQYQYSEIQEFDEIIRVGYRLQGILENVSFKVINEKHLNRSKINFNRFLREEITFLNCDLFFKHQVEKVNDFSSSIPEFDSSYAKLSGIFSECYYFFRHYVNERKEYVFLVKSFMNGSHIGFSIDFSGEFEPPRGCMAPLPLYLEGDFLEMARTRIPGLDTRFLSLCMEETRGILKMSCRQDGMKLRYEFPIPLP